MIKFLKYVKKILISIKNLPKIIDDIDKNVDYANHNLQIINELTKKLSKCEEKHKFNRQEKKKNGNS